MPTPPAEVKAWAEAPENAAAITGPLALILVKAPASAKDAEVAFAIRPEAIGFWLTRALTQNIAMTGPAQEFGEPVLRLKDPDGIIVKLRRKLEPNPDNPLVIKTVRGRGYVFTGLV